MRFNDADSGVISMGIKYDYDRREFGLFSAIQKLGLLWWLRGDNKKRIAMPVGDGFQSQCLNLINDWGKIGQFHTVPFTESMGHLQTGIGKCQCYFGWWGRGRVPQVGCVPRMRGHTRLFYPTSHQTPAPTLLPSPKERTGYDFYWDTRYASLKWAQQTG